MLLFFISIKIHFIQHNSYKVGEIIMAYVNFKEERAATKEQLDKRKKNNKEIFYKILKTKELPNIYKPDSKYSYKEFSNKKFGLEGIKDEEDFKAISDKDIICSKFINCSFRNMKFENCNFIGCIFEGCIFENGGIIFKNCYFYKEDSEKKPSLNRRDNFSCEFNNCKIYAKFDGSILAYCIFCNCAYGKH